MDWISFIDGESFAVPPMYGGMNSAERNKEGKKKSAFLKISPKTEEMQIIT